MASMFDLEKHDARFHKDGYKDGDTCMYRQEIKNYESVDDLDAAGKVSDALEDAELLEQQIAKMKNENVKTRLREHQKAAVSRAKMHLPKNMSPNKPLAHDESAFPSMDDPNWQDAIANYGNSRYGWHSAGSGSTSPHYIDINGERYFVKKAGVNPSYNSKACQNEVNANQFIRLAGFNAPDSKFYDAGQFGQFSVSEAADLLRGQLVNGTADKKLRDTVASAYPLMALMYNMDIMQNADNAFIDANSNPVFLDNGSSFGFSAQGKRNKYFDFDKRTNPFPGQSTDGGLKGLLDYGNNGSSVWSKFLNGKTSKDDLLKLCAKYNMSALVDAGEKKGLIPKSAIPAMKEYAKKLDILSDKYRDKSQNQPASQYKVSPAGAFWKSVGRPDIKLLEKDSAAAEGDSKKSPPRTKKGANSDNSGKTEEEKIADIAKKHGLTVPKLTKNSDGTVTLSGFGNATPKQMLDFIHELNDSGLLPGFIASLSGSGQVQVQSAINNGNASSLFGGMFSGLSFSGGGFGGSVSSNSSRGSLNGVQAGGFSFSGGLTSSSAQSLAKQFNQNNANSGYTAQATQTSSGEWQVTLYPTDQKKIAKAFAYEDTSEKTDSVSSKSAGVSSSSSSSSPQSSNGGNSSSSSNSSTSTQSSSSSSQHRPTRPRASSGSSTSSATSQQQNQSPNVNTQTPQQVAAAVAQMPKAAAGAFVNMLKKREANPATPAGLKAKYQRVLALLGQGVSSAMQQSSSSAPQSSVSTQMPANIPNTPAAKRLVKMINATSDANQKAKLISNLNAMIGKPSSAVSSLTASPAAPVAQQQNQTGSSSSSNLTSLSQAAMSLNTPLAKRLRSRIAMNQPGTPFYQSLVNQLNTLAGSGTAS